MKKKKLKKKIKRLEKRNEELCDDIYSYFSKDATGISKAVISSKYRFLIAAEELLLTGDATDKDI